mmetsp:Transcript_21088/g.50641  ORF Transcript_21088/g.50641 Transcript_21088/m.50641 type:complete len:115 (+) Transcript_21088:784-1128(+)
MSAMRGLYQYSHGFEIVSLLSRCNLTLRHQQSGSLMAAALAQTLHLSMTIVNAAFCEAHIQSSTKSSPGDDAHFSMLRYGHSHVSSNGIIQSTDNLSTGVYDDFSEDMPLHAFI